MVRLAGIEPTTPWFVAKYSIQLSYSRILKKHILARQIQVPLGADPDPPATIDGSGFGSTLW